MMSAVKNCFLRYAIVPLILQACCSADLPMLCGPGQFTCSDGRCIPMSWVCDGLVDCLAGLDELANCTSCGPDDFECNNKQCIPQHRACDGVMDCYDKSDEKHCAKRPERRASCGSQFFSCDNGTCLSMGKVCNKEMDCRDLSDEGGRCELMECSNANGGCSHLCHNTPKGPLCGCPSGFIKGPDGKTCKDLDECTNGVDSCSQICINTIGSYQCACVKGYHVTSDRRGCSIKEYALFFMVGQRLFILDSNKRQPSVLLPVQGDGGGMDYHLNDMKLFWADNIRKVIYTASIHGSGNDITVVVREIGRVDGIAVDWVGSNLYWTDDDKDTIEVAQLTGEHRTTLFRTGLDKPRDIALDPSNGYMYWTDWGLIAKIERSHMDGRKREILVLSDISWPNGLALDLPNERLYWTDGKRKKIESIKLNGSNRRSFDLGKRSHPFTLTVFGDHVFWTDGLSSNLEKADKRSGKGRLVLLHTKNRPSNVRVFHPLMKPKISNPCNDSKCQHLCLLSPRDYTCACEDSSKNSTAGQSCIKGKPSSTAKPAWTAANPFLSTSGHKQPKTTRRIFWNKTNLKAKKSNKRFPPSKSKNPTEKTRTGVEDSRSRNESRELFLCLLNMCKDMETCNPQEMKRNQTNLSTIVREVGNCTCVEVMRGKCGAFKLGSKKSKRHGFNFHWVLFFIVTSVLMVFMVVIFLMWQRIHEKLGTGTRVAYNKQLQRIHVTNLPNNEFDFDDDDEESRILNPPSGYENPVYLGSTSDILNSTSGLIHSTSGFMKSDSGHLYPDGKVTVSKKNNEDGSCQNKFSYSHVDGKTGASDVNGNESYQFVNPVYFSPDI